MMDFINEHQKKSEPAKERRKKSEAPASKPDWMSDFE
jgi:hypothetical protein